ncbi:MAG: 50S ribosomal protein L35 [Egibacteraceae bacterium]
MPKQKTHSGAKKRFRLTKNGKVIRQRMGMNHILEKKSSTRKRRLNQETTLSGGDANRIKRLLGGR